MSAIVFLEETGPNTELAWLLLIFLGFFVLMIVTGWWSSRHGVTQPEPTPEMQVHPDDPVASREDRHPEEGHSA